ncbi:hypothetical protein AZE42_11328 [Rhizopogon vesiculosus]|uniref:Uncharacterized protein n=1 Tax=Rhizopogon vesiculosus TaxID=180088 RepID=A0A1J8Q2M2_9AGAM|nr:hypothetical protein AZE42_11328 [Rhizopogon vesiculosus]
MKELESLSAADATQSSQQLRQLTP